MDPVETNGRSATSEKPAAESIEASKVSPVGTSVNSASRILPAQGTPVPCPACGAAQDEVSTNSLYIYANGKVAWRFPDPSVEREIAQATGRAETAGKTDRQAFYQVLRSHENRSLARQLCWIFMIQGIETYILRPRDPADFDLLVEAIEPHPTQWISTVVGVRGPLAPPEFCNGLMIPIVIVDRIHTYSEESLIEAIPRPEGVPPEEFQAAARELFDRIMQMSDNAGSTDEHRALNYLATQYAAFHERGYKEFARGYSLTAIETRPLLLSGRRNVDVILSFREREKDFTNKFFVRVDVHGEFPFLRNKLASYVDRT